jgi:hypothetical protein
MSVDWVDDDEVGGTALGSVGEDTVGSAAGVSQPVTAWHDSDKRLNTRIKTASGFMNCSSSDD